MYSQILLLSGNSLFSCLFWSEILQGNQKTVEFTKRKNIFNRFKIFSLFWRYDTCICCNEMFPIIFNICNTSFISSKYEVNKTFLISVKLTTLSQLLYQVPGCRVIWLQYIFNFYYFWRFLKEIWHNNISSSVYHQY